MVDPALSHRLAQVNVPVQVIWGESDGIVDVVYGQAHAEAIPAAQFTRLPNAGPQVEVPEELLTAMGA